MSHELQMAYQFSQLTTDRNPDADAIGAALDLGLFVVVMHCHDYCRLTDASLPGTTRRLATVTHDTKATYRALEQAILFCDQQNQDEEATAFGEVSYTVIGPDRATLHPRHTVLGAQDQVSLGDCPF